MLTFLDWIKDQNLDLKIISKGLLKVEQGVMILKR